MKKLAIVLVFSIIPLMLTAQRHNERFDKYFEKYKAERVSFLTQKLDLSVAQAEKFWPVYNEYQSKREALLELRRPMRYRSGIDSLSVKQMEEFMDVKISSELKMAELAADYHKKFKKILPVEKVFILYRAEQEFMGHMMNRMRDSGSSRGPGRRK